MSSIGTKPTPKREVLCSSCGTEPLEIEMERDNGTCMECQRANTQRVMEAS